jgi:hypothetical protein
MHRIRMRWNITMVWIGLLAGLCAAAPAAAASKSEKLRALSDALFTNTTIRHLRLEISQSGMNALRRYHYSRNADPDDRPDVPCTVREGDQVYTNVAVHLKGAAGSFRPVDSKPALTLKFDKWVEGQVFHGLEKISLNNSVQDDSFLNEKLGRELFAKAGVPVPRSDYATVELNGRALGLYVLVEGWNKQFLKHHFPDAKGNLYDAPLTSDVDKVLNVVSGENPNDQSDARALAQVCKDPRPTNRLALLETILDVDRFISLVALDCLIWNWDGYAMNKNNYRVFHDNSTGRLVFMPHGLDQLFWKPEGPIVTGRNGLVGRALLSSPEGRKRVLDRVEQLRRTVFTPETVNRRVDELAARLKSAARQGGLINSARHEQAVQLQKRRIAQRFRSVDEQLAGVKNLLAIGIGDTTTITNWRPLVVSGAATLTMSNEPSLLCTKLTRPGTARWISTVWLDEGIYTISARIQTRDVQTDPAMPGAGVGLRVWSQRKQTDGRSWGWFPFNESRDYSRRGDVAATNCVRTRLVADSDWAVVKYEIELRNPMADLEVSCELTGQTGEAWFDAKSLRITRRSDWCP